MRISSALIDLFRAKVAQPITRLGEAVVPEEKILRKIAERLREPDAGYYADRTVHWRFRARNFRDREGLPSKVSWGKLGDVFQDADLENWRRDHPIPSDPTLQVGDVHRDRTVPPSQRVADHMEELHLQGTEIVWNPETGIFSNVLHLWARSSEDPLPPLAWLPYRTTSYSCFGVVLRAAVEDGALDRAQIRTIVEPSRNFEHELPNRLVPTGRQALTHEPNSPQPQRGDLILWNGGTAHVAVATGRVHPENGSPMVYSFMRMPDSPEVAGVRGELGSGGLSRVEEISVAEINKRLALSPSLGEDPIRVEFGTGPWGPG